MRGQGVFAVAALAAILSGCAAVPSKVYRTVDAPVDGCGYRLDAETAAGFVLEVALMKYSFIPDHSAAIEAGRECFQRTAAELAKRRGKVAAPVTLADMTSNADRNVLTGQHLVIVTGKVTFQP